MKCITLIEDNIELSTPISKRELQVTRFKKKSFYLNSTDMNAYKDKESMTFRQ